MIKLSNYITCIDWRSALSTTLRSGKVKLLESFLTNEIKSGRIIKPDLENVFRSINLCLPACQVVILGQDPYPAPGVADGLAFSSRGPGPLPPSLKNIFKEISFSIYHKHMPVRHGDLTLWADQGVLLLNTVLTVGERPMSHADVGWEHITKKILEVVIAEPTPKVFLIWGKAAKEFVNDIPYIENCHLWLTAAHPSPLSVRKGFFGCDHFNKANEFLGKHKREMVSWGCVFNGKTEAFGSGDSEENERVDAKGYSRSTG